MLLTNLVVVLDCEKRSLDMFVGETDHTCI